MRPMQKLYFVRHGLSQMNIHGLFAGHTETPLTDRGRLQAVEAGQHALQLKLDLIISSPLDRAHETAVIIATEIGYPVDKIITSDLLLERNFGIMEGRDYEPNLNIDKNVPGAETIEELLERAHAAITWLRQQEADNILVVSHGAIGRALRHDVSPEIEFTLKMDNGQIVELI
jgi:uncharacterized phosphatase